MIYDPFLWFNPTYMIHCGYEAQRILQDSGQGISRDLRKAISESRAASILCLGINLLHKIELRIQLVDPKKEQSPDVRVMWKTPMPEGSKYREKGQFLDIEVVSFESNSPETQVDDFLKRTKFSVTKSYDPGTIILCFIDRDITNGILWRDVQASLVSLTPRNDTFLIGRTHPSKMIYQMARVHPQFDSIIKIDVLEEAKKKYVEPEGTLFLNQPLPNQKTNRVLKRGINPFLED